MTRKEMTRGLLNSLVSSRFIPAAVVLALAAAGLRPALSALSSYYAKEPIAIRKSLTEFDMSSLPSFGAGWTISDIPTDEIDTEEYILARLRRTSSVVQPREVVFSATYYSDPESNVPHTPDVCYRQSGASVLDMKNITIAVPEFSLCPQIKARLLLLRVKDHNQAIIFFFYADGKFKHSREQVRWAIGKPGNRRVYFSKIEAASGYPLGGEPGAAIDLCKSVLAEAVPVLISEHFPTAEQLRR